MTAKDGVSRAERITNAFLELPVSRRSLVIFGVMHLFVFCLFIVVAQFFYPATGELERYVSLEILNGHVPYRDFAFEYPPLALLSFLVPGLISRTPLGYNLAFAAEMLLFDAIAIGLMASLATRLKISVSNSLVVYTLLILAIGPLAISRYDLLPAMLVLLALSAFVSGKTDTAWAGLALGVMAKWYPAIIVPFFVIYHMRNRQYGRLVRGGVIFLVVLLVLTVPWLIIDASGFWYSLTYHLERGLHSESSYGTALLIGQILGMIRVQGDLTFGSWNLSSPLADSLARMALYISAGFLIMVYCRFGWLLWKSSKAGTEIGTSEPLGPLLPQYASLGLIMFLLTNKVFSPQFLIWLCPLLPLITGRRRYVLWSLFLVAAALTQYVYPYHYTEFTFGDPYSVGMLVGRSFLLAAIAILIALPHRSVEEATVRGYSREGSFSFHEGG